MFEIVDPVMIGGGIALAMFVGILGCLWLGRWTGRRAILRQRAPGRPGVGSLETSIFALLGLLIAFTFSGALARFDLRRSQIVDEANAIGTAYLRIDLLPQSTQPRLREAFRNYVDARIATYHKLPDLKAARRELVRAQELQAEVWAQAVTAVHAPESGPATESLVISSLNEMFDVSTERAVATQMHPPTMIYAMLIALALASGLLAGYQSAGEKGYTVLQQIAFAAAVSLTVYVILNIEYPRLGWADIEAIDQALINVRAGMK